MRAIVLVVFVCGVFGCPAPSPTDTRQGPVDAGPVLAEVGEGCDGDDDCASGLCAWNGSSSLCADNECGPEIGVACDATTNCTGGPCGRTCELPRARGAECTFFSDDNPCPTSAVCAEGLVCGVRNSFKFGDGTCVPPTDRAAGEVCDSDADCSQGLTCDAQKRCLAPT